jgi:hypothetical protein
MGNISVMATSESSSVPGVLDAAGQDDKTPLGELRSLLYPESRSLAHQRVRSFHNVHMLDALL